MINFLSESKRLKRSEVTTHETKHLAPMEHDDMKATIRKTMTSLLIAVCLALATVALVLAEIPRLISYQGRVTNADGSPVPDGNHSVRFDLYTTMTSTVSQWNETATVATSSGLFSHLLGSVNTMPEYRFSNDSFFLQITYEGQVQSPRTPLVSVPYARRVNSLSQAKGGTILGDVQLWDTLNSRGFAYVNLGSDDQPEFYLSGTSRFVWLDMGQSGSSSVQLPSSAIQASEILDEPGVGSDNNTSISLTGSPVFLAGRTMFAPVDGFVLVIATANMNIQHVNGTISSCAFGVSDKITDFVQSTVSNVILSSSLSTGIYRLPVVSHALFPVAAGSQAYYSLGQMSGALSATVYNVQLTECFFPTAYTTVSTPVPIGSVSAEPFNPESERLEAEAFHKKRVDDELAKLKVEIELLKKLLDEKGDRSSTN